MENPIFFIYLAVAVFATSAIAIVIRRLLAVRGRKILSKKKFESFLTTFSEAYYKAYHHDAIREYDLVKNAKKMRQSIETDMNVPFNYLLCSITHFPKSFQKDYIDEESGIFVDKMIPVLESLLDQSISRKKYSRPKISDLQKAFFERIEIEMIKHLSDQEDGSRQIQITIPSFARDFFYI